MILSANRIPYLQNAFPIWKTHSLSANRIPYLQENRISYTPHLIHAACDVIMRATVVDVLYTNIFNFSKKTFNLAHLLGQKLL
jgi:hypothetical protein